MAYDTKLADRIREYLVEIPELEIEEKKEYNGFCFINPDGIKSKNDFEYFVNLSLEYNKIAKSSKKRRNTDSE